MVRKGAVLAAAVLLAAPGVGRAAERELIGTWNDGCATCTDPGPASRPVLAVAPSGAAVVAWDVRFEGVWAATRPAGGGWGAPVRLSAFAGDPSVVFGGRPAAAINANGRAVVAWDEAGPGKEGPMTAAFADTRTGRWSASEALPGPASGTGDVAIDRRGDAALAWVGYARGTEEGGRVLVSYRRAGQSQWPSPSVVGGGPERPGHPFDGLGREPQVVLTRAGAAKVIWAEDLVSAFNRSFGEYVRSRGRSAGAGRWGPLETLVRVRRKRLQSPLLALSPSGALAAAWQEGGNSMQTFYATASRDPRGWRPAVPVLYARASEGLGSSLVIGPRGVATLALTSYGIDSGVVQAVSGDPSTGRWGKATELGEGEDTAVGIGSIGSVAVAWTRTELPRPGAARVAAVTLRRRTPAGRWAPAEQLSAEGVRAVDPAVGVDAAGTATVVWLDRGGAVEAATVPLRTG